MKTGDWVNADSVGHTTPESAKASRDRYVEACPDIRFRIRYSTGWWIVQRFQPRYPGGTR